MLINVDELCELAAALADEEASRERLSGSRTVEMSLASCLHAHCDSCLLSIRCCADGYYTVELYFLLEQGTMVSIPFYCCCINVQMVSQFSTHQRLYTFQPTSPPPILSNQNCSRWMGDVGVNSKSTRSSCRVNCCTFLITLLWPCPRRCDGSMRSTICFTEGGR